MRIRTNQVYRLTDAGILAVRAQRSVPGWYRTILAMMEGDTPSERVCEILSAHSKKQVMAWLDQLETLGFVVAVAAVDESSALSHRQAA
jgi:hypothetical protein